MAAWSDDHFYLKPGGQGPQQLQFDAEANQGGHGAVGDGGGDVDDGATGSVVNSAEGLANYVKLLEGEGMFRVLDVPDEVEHFPGIHGIANVVVQVRGKAGTV